MSIRCLGIIVLQHRKEKDLVVQILATHALMRIQSMSIRCLGIMVLQHRKEKDLVVQILGIIVQKQKGR